MSNPEASPRPDPAQRLIDAARAVLAERAFDAELAEILERAQVGTSTAYRIFSGKEEIVRQVVDELANRTRDDLLQIAVEVQDAREAIRRTMAMGFQRVREYGQLPIAMFSGVNPPQYEDAIDRKALHAFFAALVERGIQQGYFDPEVDVDHAVAVWFALAAPQALRMLMQTRSVDRIADLTTHFYLAGLSRRTRDPTGARG